MVNFFDTWGGAFLKEIFLPSSYYLNHQLGTIYLSNTTLFITSIIISLLLLVTFRNIFRITKLLKNKWRSWGVASGLTIIELMLRLPIRIINLVLNIGSRYTVFGVFIEITVIFLILIGFVIINTFLVKQAHKRKRKEKNIMEESK